MPRRASSRTGSKVDARRAQTVAAALDPLLDEADLPGEVPEFVKRGALLYLLTQAVGKLPYARTLWLLDAVARHATAASSDFFAFPFGGRANGRVYRQCRQRPQRPREPCTVRFAPQAATRTPSASSACGCRPKKRRGVRRDRRLFFRAADVRRDFFRRLFPAERIKPFRNTSRDMHTLCPETDAPPQSRDRARAE